MLSCHLLSYLDVIYLIYLTIMVYPIKTRQTDREANFNCCNTISFSEIDT